jgi:integral membrane protein
MSPRSLFTTVAVAEALSWAFLLTAMFFKYVIRSTEALVPPAGGIHGFVFLCFVLTTVFVWINSKWSLASGLLGLASAVVPFATVPFERWMQRRGRLDGSWRLAPGGETPRNPAEKLQGWVLRSPVLAGVLALVGVTVVFALLLVAGPPVAAG